MDLETMPRKLWEHPNPKETEMWRFMQSCNDRFGLTMQVRKPARGSHPNPLPLVLTYFCFPFLSHQTFDHLYAWSCTRRADFWGAVWASQRAIHEGSFARVVDEAVPVDGLPRWFDGVRLNFAENYLYRRGWEHGPGTRGTRDKEDAKLALTEVREGGADAARDVTWGRLRRDAGCLASAMQARGVRKGDRIVAVGANSYTTLLVFLAATWLGALFSSSSTDMGVNGLLQRTTQIDPKFVFFDDAAVYNGRRIDLRDKMAGMLTGLIAECRSFEAIISMPRFPTAGPTGHLGPRVEPWASFLAAGDSSPPEFVRVGFQDPMVIYYSSGTTGAPKAIVHGVGPMLLTGYKESILHRRMDPADVVLQYTTTGWIMYMSSVGALIGGAASVLYDGSPLLPDAGVLVRLVARYRVTVLGVSPRWMAELIKKGLAPRDMADVSTLKVVTCTGMVLPDQMFDWFYDVGFHKHTQLANISGGTDIAGCFVLENPLKPLYRGGCMGGSLGVPIAVYDHDMDDGSAGRPVPAGTSGDLVATAAFPNTPLYLWGDGATAPGPKYRGAYYERFRHVWAQGDFCQVHVRTGAVLMQGRSDGVLNPSGVRFGSADIYAVLDRHFAAHVADSICVGQRRPADPDEQVLLFVLMRAPGSLTRALVADIRAAIARELTKRHVPKYIFEIPEIPTTVNGKKVELPVKKIICGKTVKPSGTLLNPGSLDYFYRFQKIEELTEPQAKL
ncbi:acetoacetyl-CoA synthase [Cordyceps militaris CM01]|uniref:Acetoacetyl-CoA synthase n=1 Tax=Cordyceps militaris (strain CM01) TaxID=983644 RepID=G3J8W9_CORMM|nr:acetoacetyl-CoA synthase [Cordyceps militaris CM01]EGX94852.1 acetoacetyl-CoA synthase [Cordyceps militaris CM01]